MRLTFALVLLAVFAMVGCARHPSNQLLVRFGCRFGDEIQLPVTINLGDATALVKTSSDSYLGMPLGSANGDLVLDTKGSDPLLVRIRHDGTAVAKFRLGPSAPLTEIEGLCERL